MTLLSRADAAAHLGVSTSTIGRITGFVRIGNQRNLRFTLESVEKVAAERLAREERTDTQASSGSQDHARRRAARAERKAARTALATERARLRAAQAAVKAQQRAEQQRIAAAARAERESERQRRRAAQLEKVTYKFLSAADKPGDLVFAPSRAARLAAELTPDELVYSPPCSLATDDSAWFDARKGGSPRWAVLVAGLAARGLRLVYEGAYYWRVI